MAFRPRNRLSKNAVTIRGSSLFLPSCRLLSPSGGRGDRWRRACCRAAAPAYLLMQTLRWPSTATGDPDGRDIWHGHLLEDRTGRHTGAHYEWKGVIPYASTAGARIGSRDHRERCLVAWRCCCGTQRQTVPQPCPFYQPNVLRKVNSGLSKRPKAENVMLTRLLFIA